jgi:hypothetical protein
MRKLEFKCHAAFDGYVRWGYGVSNPIIERVHRFHDFGLKFLGKIMEGYRKAMIYEDT